MSISLALWASLAFAADPDALSQLIEAARQKPVSPNLKQLLTAHSVNDRGRAVVYGQDFLFAIATNNTPSVSIDNQPGLPLERVPDGNLWYRLAKMRTGVTYSVQFLADGQPVGPRTDVPGYNPDSYPHPGVPNGQLSEKKVISSRLYPGMTSEYWIYVSPGYDSATGAALMVWQDGQGLTGEHSSMRLRTVTENLVHQRLIPPMIHVLIAPGIGPNSRRMRSVQYDTVSDRYGRFLMEEVLPEVEKLYKVRQDGYSRAIGGSSSGGICAFNVAWHFPKKFSRVHSTVGSYTSLQWKFGNANLAENIEGANVYPFMVRKQPKRNVRIWMSDGSDDLENTHGSWPLQNIQLANSLKMRGYDFHFRFGNAAYNGSQAVLDLPEALAWLWREYDASKTEQVYEMEPEEKGKPMYRVKIGNRDAW